MRLIDADALADALFEKRKNYSQWVADVIGNMPDAVIRCKDCKHRNNSLYCPIALLAETVMKTKVFDFKVSDDWFCADGEKKDG